MSPRFAILQCDSVLEQFQPQHGDYPIMFRETLAAAGLPASQLDCVDVRNPENLPAVDAYAGYLVTGSRYSVYDDLPWIAELAGFVESAMAQCLPVVGVCFGHQLLAHFFGGQVGPAPVGWTVGVQHVHVSQQHPWMRPPAAQLNMLSSHKDQVLRLPANAQVFASTDTCPVAGFTLGDYGLGIQGHPEFNAPYAADLMNYRQSLLGEQIYQTGVQSLTCPLTSSITARWVVQFLQSQQLQDPLATHG